MATTITANGINFPDGSAGSPSIGGTDTNTGLFTGSDIVGFATGGSERLRIDASGNINIANDSGKLQLGTGADLKLYHDGSNSWLLNDTGNLILKDLTDAIYIQAPSIIFNDETTNENIARFISDGACELYYDDSKKLDTTSAGIEVTGRIALMDASDSSGSGNALWLGAGNDLKIFHDGTHSNIVNSTGELKIRGAASQAITFRNSDDSANVAVFNIDDATHLYFDSAHKFSTTSTGIKVVGNCLPNSNDSGQLGTSSVRWQELNISDVIDVSDNGKIRIGDSDDLQIYHDGTNSYIDETNGSNNLWIRGQANIYMGHGSEKMATFSPNGAVELYHNDIKRLETATNGVTIYGDIVLDSRKDWYVFSGSVYLNDGESHDIVTSASGYIWADFELFIVSYHGSIGRGHWAGNCSQYGGGHDYQFSNGMSYASMARFNNGSDSGIKINRTGTYGSVGFHWTVLCRCANTQGTWQAGSSSHTTLRAKL